MSSTRARRAASRLDVLPVKPSKACRSCDIVKPLASFSPHRLAKDGHRHDCKACAKAERAKRAAIPTKAQREADRTRRAAPHRIAANRQAVRRWTERNPAARRARRILRTAIAAGLIGVPKRCQARDCKHTGRLQAHHHDHHQPLQVAWVCARCHRRGHARGYVKLDRRLARKLGKIPKDLQ